MSNELLSIPDGACMHPKVALRTEERPEGTRAFWECETEGCGTKFWPTPTTRCLWRGHGGQATEAPAPGVAP